MAPKCELFAKAPRGRRKKLRAFRASRRILARFKKSVRFHQRSDAACPLYLAAERGEHFLEALVAPIDVFQTDDLRFARRSKARNDERRAGADVRSLDGRARKRRAAF